MHWASERESTGIEDDLIIILKDTPTVLSTPRRVLLLNHLPLVIARRLFHKKI